MATQSQPPPQPCPRSLTGSGWPRPWGCCGAGQGDAALLWRCSCRAPPGASPGWWWGAQHWWASAPQTWQQEVLGSPWGLNVPIRFRPRGMGLSSPDQGSDHQHGALPSRTRFSYQNTARATFRGSEPHPCPVWHKTGIRTVPSHIPHTSLEGYSKQHLCSGESLRPLNPQESVPPTLSIPVPHTWHFPGWPWHLAAPSLCWLSSHPYRC